MLSSDRDILDVDSPLVPDRAQSAVLAALFVSAMDAVIALDEEQRVVLFNPAAEAMFGCPAFEAIGQPIDRFLPGRFRAVHRHHVATFGATGDTARTMGHLRPLTAVRAGGQEFPIEATISRVAVGGHPLYAAIVRDISARETAAAALRQQADMLDLAYDAIFTWDWHGPITAWNRGAERLYGFSRDEAVGQVSHNLLRTRHPGGQHQMMIAIERNGTWEGELVQSRRDGAEVVVESRHVLVRDGERAYVLEANRDVTARKRAEDERVHVLERETAARAEAAASAAQRDRLGEILDGLPSGVFIASRDLRIDFANLAMIELVRGADAPDEPLPAYGEAFWFLRADGIPLPTDERPGARALRGERVRHQQLLLERADGERLPVSVHAAPLRDGTETPAGVVVVLQDVTQLRQAEQLKDDFLALISHEFRTPLTAIHGGAHLLATQGETLDAESRDEVLADVVAESARMDRMLGNILMLADVMAGRLRTATEPVLVAPLAQRVASEVARRAPHHELVVAAENVPPVEADPNLLDEVLRNLYENALKYAPDGGEVRTTVARIGATIAIHVTDEGIGIAPEHVGAVFERFRRVGGDPTVRGMGLGLYLSRHLVEAMGGRIGVTSPGIGHGTTFTLTLPLAHDWAGDEDTANR